MHIPIVQANYLLTMNVLYTSQFGLSSNYSYNYSYNKNCTIPYFINLISDRANFAVSGPFSLLSTRMCFVFSLYLF